MTAFDAILEDIRANPADDLPRLALADWLMEQDDPAARSRGEFIHARCRAASLPPRDPERAALQHRAEELRERHEIDWLGGLAEHLESWEFERGMIVAGVSDRSVRSGPFSRMAACDGWKWVIGLRGAALSARELLSLFKRPGLKSVTSLHLRDSEMSWAALTALSGSAHLAGLISLDLGYSRLGTAFRAILRSQYLTELRILLVDGNGISPEGVVDLAASSALPRLESLDLSCNPVEDRGISAIARSSHFPALRELRLGSCVIHAQGGIALATSAARANLTLLDLRDNPIDEDTRAELRESFGERVILD